MTLTDEMGAQGSWLFRWRSYLPLLLLGVLLPPSLYGLHWPFDSHRFHVMWEFACLLVSFSGIAVRCATVGFVPRDTSGRGTLRPNAAVLNTTGMYSLVRHPVYLGNFLIGLGVTLVWFDWWAPVIYSLCFWLYYERIMIAEERYLERRFGDTFRRWASVTPSFLPRPTQLRRWKRPVMPFSPRSTVQREYSTLALVIVLHTSMEAIENYWFGGQLSLGFGWGCMLISAIAIYIGIRSLKKGTGLLIVHGR